MFNKVYDKFKNFIKKEWKFLLFLIAFALFTNLRLPYLIEAPGGSIPLYDRVKIDGAYDAKGSFSMAYVTMVRGTPASLLVGAIRKDWDIIKYDDVTLENEDYEESVNRDKLYLKESIANATIAAYRAADKKLEIKSANNEVVYISSEANTSLELDDKILYVNGERCNTLEEMKEVIKDMNAGDLVDFIVLRDDKEVEASATLYDTSDGVKVGIITVTNYEYESDPRIKVTFKESESGPSGGLMTALEIYNQLTPNDLTDGKDIIGTGTIDVNGNVGEIGGVKYKLAGAVKKKADIFLCPMGNLEEALAVKEEFGYTIKVKGISTLEEAIKYLEG